MYCSFPPCIAPGAAAAVLNSEERRGGVIKQQSESSPLTVLLCLLAAGKGLGLRSPRALSLNRKPWALNPILLCLRAAGGRVDIQFKGGEGSLAALPNMPDYQP